MITRSKKKKSPENDAQSQEKSNVEELPVDIEIEIFKRLPVKSIGRFLLVSKSWATIIQSRDLITPRLLVAFVDVDSQKKLQNWHFFSSSSSLSSSASTSFLSRAACPSLNLNSVKCRSHYVNGLICFGYGTQQTICNLSTGKSITLPKVKTRMRTVKSFFGYDPVNDQYKVLCMTNKMYCPPREPSSQHQVFTLGAKQKSWRMIECSIPHRPFSNGVCIDGVVYYLAYAGEGMSQRSLMRFDLRSEKLDLFTTLSAVIPNGSTLINYKRKVAFATQQPSTLTFDLWVMDQDQHAVNHEWLMKSFRLEPWRSLIKFNALYITCATYTGCFVLVPVPSYYSSDVFLYNLDKNSFSHIKIEVSGDYEFKPDQTRAVVFSD